MLHNDNYTTETEQFAFYKIPKALFTNPQFSGLSVEAKVLYGLMLDRLSLSQRSGWLDEAGRVYIYFSNKDVQEQLGCGHCKASRHLKELETSGLIARQRQWMGNPDRIYVRDFSDLQDAENETSENAGASMAASEKERTDDSECDNVSSSDSQPSENEQTGNSQCDSAPASGVRTSENETMDDSMRKTALNSSTQTAETERKTVSKHENSPVFSARMSEKGHTGRLKHGAPDVSKTAPNKTEYIKTEMIKTKSIHPHQEKFTSTVQEDGRDGAKEKLKQVWGYPALLDSHSKETLDGIFTLGADILQDASPTIRVNRQEMPAKTVKQRLLSLDFTHIDYVLDCLRRVSAPIRDVRRYLLTALYNAPATIDAYYDALFARNEAGREVMPAFAY